MYEECFLRRGILVHQQSKQEEARDYTAGDYLRDFRKEEETHTHYKIGLKRRPSFLDDNMVVKGDERQLRDIQRWLRL